MVAGLFAGFFGVPQQGTCDGHHHLASAYYGQRAALLRHMMALLQPPVWRPLQEILAGSQHLLVFKWCVPGGIKMTGDGVSDRVERTKDLCNIPNFGIKFKILHT
jgi:hypothetical protein